MEGLKISFNIEMSDSAVKEFCETEKREAELRAAHDKFDREFEATNRWIENLRHEIRQEIRSQMEEAKNNKF